MGRCSLPGAMVPLFSEHYAPTARLSHRRSLSSSLLVNGASLCVSNNILGLLLFTGTFQR